MKNIARIIFLFVLLNVVISGTLQSQTDSSLFLAEHKTLHELKTAQSLMKEKRYLESVQILWRILKTNEDDSFIRVNNDNSIENESNEKPATESTEDSDHGASSTNQNQSLQSSGRLISLKMYIQNILSQAPEEARQASELLVGAEAKNKLDAALQSGSLERLLEVSRDYFNTEAGYKATFLSGLVALNEGQAASAASLFDSLANTPGVRQKFEPAFSVLWLNSLILS